MALGYLMVIWFSFSFVMIMAGLVEFSETVERVSHIILYLMLPFSGVFIPLYAVPEKFRELLLTFPLVDSVEYFHSGYFGQALPTYYNLSYAVAANLFLTLFAFSLTKYAIKRVQLN